MCRTCGVEYRESAEAPASCPICEDPRQWVPPDGQSWTTREWLARGHRNAWRLEEPGLFSLVTEPKFAIGQQAFLVRTAEGNLLWDCIPLIDDATIGIVRALGGLRAIAISHPHYYSAMAAWSRAFGDVPIHLHSNDREWIPATGSNTELWSGTACSLFGGLTLVHCGGHFDGYQVLHREDGGGAILAGDQPQVALDQRWVSFLWSYPNMVPLSAGAVSRVVEALEPYRYERLYGAFGRHVLEDAKAVVRRSAERYRDFVQAP